MAKKTMTFDVVLNGTDENRFEEYGLTQNPFPQIAEYKYAAHLLYLQHLGGPPIPNVQYIRDYLKGWSKEFVDGLCQRFVKGYVVKITVTCPID